MGLTACYPKVLSFLEQQHLRAIDCKNCEATFPVETLVKDYDQLLNKRPRKSEAVLAWHQDMGYWSPARVSGFNDTTTVTFSLAVDESDEANGC